MRAIWKSSISFSLVNIPVKLYSATQSSTVDLDMIDKRDFGKVRFQRVNENTGKEVKWENIIKAYRYKDEYIPIEEGDFEDVAPEKSKVIEVNNFVDESEIDTIHYETSYFLEPEKGGARAYALFRKALAKSGKVGIAQFVLRTAEALSLIKPMGDVLVLSKFALPKRFAKRMISLYHLSLL